MTDFSNVGRWLIFCGLLGVMWRIGETGTDIRRIANVVCAEHDVAGK